MPTKRAEKTPRSVKSVRRIRLFRRAAAGRTARSGRARRRRRGGPDLPLTHDAGGGLLDGVVARYLDCGIFERGFARIRCPDCAAEYLLAFSCNGRGLCPSCGAKRAAEFAAFLQDEVVADVGHAQWVFTVPKLLRPYFMHHRELLGPLCASITMAWQTVRELMAVAAGEEKRFRPGMVSMSQTFGDQLNLHIPTSCAGN